MLWGLWLPTAATAVAQVEVSAWPFATSLPSLDITALHQDREGLMWIGTLHGLACYNGTHTWVAHNHQATSWRAAGAEVTSIADTRRYVFVGTKQGLGVYDKYRRQLRAAPVRGLQGAAIRHLLVDSNNRLWIAASDSLLCCNEELHVSQSYRLPKGVTSVYEDSHHRLWVLTWEGGLWRVDATTRRLLPYPRLGGRNNPFVMCEDSHHRLWIGTWGDGLYRFRPELEAPQMYSRQPSSGDIVFDLEEAVPGQQLWALAYDSLAVYGYAPYGSLTLLPAQPLAGRNRMFSTMMRDREGNIWFGAYGGGSVAHPVRQRAAGSTLPWIERHTGFEANLNALMADADGVVWLNQERAGLMLYNPADGSYNIHPYRQPEAFEMGILEPNGPRGAWMASLFVPWVFRVERQGMDLLYADTLRLQGGRIRSLATDGAGMLWVLKQGGVRIFGPALRELTSRCAVANQVSAICRQPDGGIWTATRSGHLLLWRSTEQGPQVQACYLLGALRQGQEVPCRLTASTDGQVWIATHQDGLWHFASHGRCLRRLTTRYLSAGEPILNLVSGGGTSWLVSPMRAVPLQLGGPPSAWAVGQGGLPVRTFRGTAAHVLPDGRLLAGGYGGMATLAPDHHQAAPPAARVYVTAACAPDSADEASRTLPMPLLCDTLYIQGPSVRFTLSACRLVRPQEVRYAVQLEGADTTPRVLPPGTHEASYHHLPPGAHRLRLWLADGQGRLQGQPHSYVVLVRSGHGAWRLPWPYAVVALLVGLVGLLVWRRRRGRMAPAAPPEPSRREPLSPRQLITYIIRYRQEQPQGAVPPPQDMPLTQRDYALLCQVVEVSLSHLDDSRFDLDGLTEALGTSRSTLSRRLKAVCGLTPMDVVRVVRLEVACHLLGQGGMNVSETAYAVGYTDPRYFARCFKEEFGVLPSRLSQRPQ